MLPHHSQKNYDFVQPEDANISKYITIHSIDLKFAVPLPDVLDEGSMSQIFHLGPSFY